MAPVPVRRLPRLPDTRWLYFFSPLPPFNPILLCPPLATGYSLSIRSRHTSGSLPFVYNGREISRLLALFAFLASKGSCRSAKRFHETFEWLSLFHYFHYTIEMDRGWRWIGFLVGIKRLRYLSARAFYNSVSAIAKPRSSIWIDNFRISIWTRRNHLDSLFNQFKNRRFSINDLDKTVPKPKNKRREREESERKNYAQSIEGQRGERAVRNCKSSTRWTSVCRRVKFHGQSSSRPANGIIFGLRKQHCGKKSRNEGREW